MATDLLILGTDTDAGKTTFALLWLSAFSEDFGYWKPVETGLSDSGLVQQLVPRATVHPPAQRFDEPVAPPLAARRQGQTVWLAERLAASRPSPPGRSVLIESFGSPFSPLNDSELQIAWIRHLACPMVLVSSSTLGAIGRTLQAWIALTAQGLNPRMIVLVGPADAFAEESLRKNCGDLPVFSLQPPRDWTIDDVRAAAQAQQPVLEAMRDCLLPRTLDRQESDLLQRDRQSVWHPYTSLRDSTPPLPIVGAQDEFLHLADGTRVIDGISSWWTILHGHRHPVLMDALAQASAQIDHVLFAGATHPWAVELAELLLMSMPWSGGRVFYSENGSTAVEVALKLAYQTWCHRGQPQRIRFVGFQSGYHGDTFGSMAVSRDPVFFARFEPLLFQADIVPLDPDALDEHLGRHGDRTSAVILEPLVQGAGGMRMHSPETLRQLFEVTHRHGVLFIADEVMTGGGRTGTLWAHQTAHIAPDLVCAAKTLAGGLLPLAVTIAAPHVVAAFDTEDRSRTFFHGHSFTAHPLACAVALANWKMLTSQPLHRPQALEAFWNDSLAALRDHPKVRDVRIRGSIAAIEVVGSKGYLADVGREMREKSLEHGVLLRPLGPVLYALPPYDTSRASLEQIVRAIKAALTVVD